MNGLRIALIVMLLILAVALAAQAAPRTVPVGSFPASLAVTR